jgi:8-oxo-dGTP diphosphatase
MTDFDGVTIALIQNDKLVMILRDNKPGLPFANMWEFPGGGREGNESPVDCAIREVREELSFELQKDSIVWQKEFEAMHDPKLKVHFMVARVSAAEASTMKLGTEGQKFELMRIDDCLARRDVVPRFKEMLRSYLETLNPKR